MKKSHSHSKFCGGLPKSRVRDFFDFSWRANIVCICFIFIFSTSGIAQHLRLYACAIANDDAAAFMGGSSLGAGLWTSDDSGAVWKHVGWSHVKCYSVATADSTFGNTTYLACGNGLMRSVDAGDHWRMLTGWKIAEVLDVAVNQFQPSNLTIATSTGLWVSIDSGEHWSESGSREFREHLRYDANHRAFDSLVADTLGDGKEIILQQDGGVYIQGKRLVRPYAQRGALWCITHSDSNIFVGGERGVYEYDSSKIMHLLTGSPRNTHSMIVVAKKIYLVSLSGGVWECDVSRGERIFRKTALDTLQLWSIRSAIVK